MVMPEFGAAGQARLKRGSVLVIGAGGLSCPALQYLAAAGVGKIGIVEADEVELSNLHRQILYHRDQVGRQKAPSARETLRRINPHVEVCLHPERFTVSNAQELTEAYDVILDGTDNFPTRYLSNDVAVLLGKPNVYGSVLRFQGQVTVFDPAGGGPCYRCMMPEPPPAGSIPNCAEGGVLGVMPGIMGSLQALEVIKLLTGLGEPLRGRLLVLEGLGLRWREIRLRRDPRCPVCGEAPRIKTLGDFDYAALERLCRVDPGPTSAEGVSATQLRRMMDEGQDFLLLDVRSPGEYAICRLPGSRNIPLDALREALETGQLDPEEPVIVHCKSGARSAQAVDLLKNAGFRRVRDFSGGTDGWAGEIDPAMPRY
jgi:adenylyltransferase/sulfurtransferase